MKALKILGGIVVVLGLGAFVFWFGWLRAPSPKDTCAHVRALVAKSSHPNANGLGVFSQHNCAQLLHPPKYGLLKYAKAMKCINAADSLEAVARCSRHHG